MSYRSALALLATIALALALACASSSPQETSNANTSPVISSQPTPISQPTPPPLVTNDNLSPADNLATAKTYLNGKVSEYDLTEARNRLERIPPSAPEYREAQRLLAQIKAKEKELKINPATPALDPQEDEIRQIMLSVDKSITYGQLTKNADRYQGQAWAFTCSIVQIQEAGGETSALVALDYLHNDMMKVKASFTTEFVDGDMVYVVGYLAGNYSYRSVGGLDMTIPMIEAKAILKPSDAIRIRAGKKGSNP